MSVIDFEEWRKKLENTSKAKLKLTQNIASERPGLTATEEELFKQVPFMIAMHGVLDRAWRNPFTTKSDFAREAADYVAIASFEGMITTKIATDTWGNEWLITDLGMAFREELRITLEGLANDISKLDESGSDSDDTTD